jgi:hypothetical protein
LCTAILLVYDVLDRAVMPNRYSTGGWGHGQIFFQSPEPVLVDFSIGTLSIRLFFA